MVQWNVFPAERISTQFLGGICNSNTIKLHGHILLKIEIPEILDCIILYMYYMKCFDIADRQTRHSIYINSQKTHKKSADTVSDLNGSLDNWLWFRRDGPMLAHLSIFWKKYSPSGLDLARSEPVYIWHSFLRIPIKRLCFVVYTINQQNT